MAKSKGTKPPRDPAQDPAPEPKPDPAPASAAPSLEDIQHWTGIVGQAQQQMMEHMAGALTAAADTAPAKTFPMQDPAVFLRAQAEFWQDSMALWQRFLTPATPAPAAEASPPPKTGDRRFAAPQWRDNPVFDMIRQSYLMVTDHLLKGVDQLSGLDDRQREKLRFATTAFADAMSPTNFALTNPLVLEKTVETRGQNLVKGLEHMLADIGRGQLTHTDPTAFEIGRNLAMTPGKVVRETPLYQLIQYTPATEKVGAIPLVIFPPWINRFYILDLNPEKSFIRWAVEQGLTVFVVSWKSADATMVDVTMDDYILRGQVDAIDTVRDLLDVPAVHTIGYCVAGTALACTLAILTERGQADKVASATFFTAQVDFDQAGELTMFIDDEQLAMLGKLSAETGYLDGRYMALTFNLLRGRDLIWNYVVNNYLLGQDYPPFDLLHWNGDTTNLPAKWHQAYLTDLYRDNKLARAGEYVIDGTPIDLSVIHTPAYIQAGREDHIAPVESVFKLTRHLSGPVRFVLAGSGHIAGVVNPPSATKYQYWVNEAKVDTLDAFVADATETKGSWWPDWRRWIAALDGETVAVDGARIPGEGKLPAIEDAPGRYVRTR
ncbi:class I poly(R)-hydroxyalkanoic acid synthase [Sphingomonas prati]|uniref:Polyhydroxyalkanoate synthase n=2 Tax=Sphingomonas prati TaxID=1843237 RepID=A0A7W9BSJ4_9SPHN|nr:polyhydroxyalkanoate synthase [Sphingomonas prati]GGE84301.1 class I poly(R)-hydroxyalkanoic acid synthase [Sphingomonas prati]